MKHKQASNESYRLVVFRQKILEIEITMHTYSTESCNCAKVKKKNAINISFALGLSCSWKKIPQDHRNYTYTKHMCRFIYFIFFLSSFFSSLIHEKFLSPYRCTYIIISTVVDIRDSRMWSVI